MNPRYPLNYRTIYAEFAVPRLRSESRVKEPDGETMVVSVLDIPNDRWLMTTSRQETTWVGRPTKNYRSFLADLREFRQKQGVTSAKDTLKGRETVKYRLEEGSKTVSLWVDAKTKCPVRMEQETR